MALSLRTAINATDTTLDISGTSPVLKAGQIIQIGSEQMVLLGTGGDRGDGQPAHALWVVAREALNTSAATHAATTAVTLASFGGGGGSISVDNGIDPPAAVTTLVAPGADVSTPGTADMSGLLQYRLLHIAVAFDTPNLKTSGVALGTMAEGELMLQRGAYTTIAFNGTNPQLRILDANDNAPLTAYVDVADNLASGPLDLLGNVDYQSMTRARSSAPVRVVLSEDSPSTAGAADIYAIVADTPAS